MCVVASSLINEHGCLRNANKTELVKYLGVLDIFPTLADIIIIDVPQLFYHIVWPLGGWPSDLIASTQGRLSHYPDGTEKKYQDVSAKDHERMWRTVENIVDYYFSITSLLLKRDAILKSKNNNQKPASVLCTSTVEDNFTMDTQNDSAFGHDEADMTMISFVLEAAKHGKDAICVLSDSKDVFVLLMYWVYRAELQCKIQIEWWDGTVLDINATCYDLALQTLQLLCMYALSGCDTTSSSYGNNKISTLNTFLEGKFQWLTDVLVEVQGKKYNTEA